MNKKQRRREAKTSQPAAKPSKSGKSKPAPDPIEQPVPDDTEDQDQ